MDILAFFALESILFIYTVSLYSHFTKKFQIF